MKKLLLLILSLTMAIGVICATGCANNETPNGSTDITSEIPEEKTYTITFKQDGKLDIVKEVKEGESLTDIPTPATKIGYTVVWENKDLTNIQENITVNAVETPNKYTVTYDTDGGAAIEALQVTFDGDYVLPVPVKEGFTFTGWTYQGNGITSSGKWAIASNVTVKATWQEIIVQKYTVTFVQNGAPNQVYTVEEGAACTEIPTPVSKTGYTIEWKSEDLAKLNAVTENLVIEAVETPKTYQVTLNANGGSVSNAQVTFVYDAAYELEQPTRTGFEFVRWEKDGVAFDAKGVWNIDENNVTLKAIWKEIEDDNDDENWTNNY